MGSYGALPISPRYYPSLNRSNGATLLLITHYSLLINLPRRDRTFQFSPFTFHLHSTHYPHYPHKTKQQPSQIISVKKTKILVFKFFVRIFATDLCYFCNKLINIYIN